jgi:hypothetical protein
VVEKFLELARITGLTKTGSLEKAVDEILRATGSKAVVHLQKKILVLLVQFDRLKHQSSNQNTAIAWDKNGLPKCSPSIRLQ